MGKILLSGLSGSGKSSIYEETYKKISAEDENPYVKSIIKIKSLEGVLGINFLEEEGDIIDSFSSDQLEELFTDVQVLLWIVDVTDQRNLSTSSFYWKKFDKNINTYSRFAKRLICFHKTDLLTMEDPKSFFNSLIETFKSPFTDQTSFYYTSLKNSSTQEMMSDCLKKIRESSIAINQTENKIKEFLQTNEDFFGAIILSSDSGLPVIEMGEKIDYVTLPANLWLSTNDRLKEAFKIKHLACTIHLDEQTLIFLDLSEDLLLTTITKEGAPLQFSFIRSNLLAQSIRDILEEA